MQELNEEQTATLETALLHAALAGDRAGPDANRSVGLQSNRVALDVSSHQGLVELARRRSDLSEHLGTFVCARKSNYSRMFVMPAQSMRHPA